MASVCSTQLIFFVACILNAHAMIEDWDPTVQFANDPNIVHYSPMYNMEESPGGDGTSTIFYNFTITRENTEASLTFLIYNLDVASYIGSYPNGQEQKEYCCTNPQKQTCDKIGDVIIHEPTGSLKPLLSQNVLVPNGKKEQTISLEYNVTKTGIYYFLIVSCDYDTQKGKIFIDGSCAWLNPYGYLPGDVYMKFPMSGLFALIYVATFIAFSILCVRYRAVLLKLQYVILFGIFLCVLEASAWYFYRLTNNTYGHYSITSLFVVVFIAIIRKTFLHLLVLLLSMGIGIVKWTIGTAKIKLALLSLFYLFFAFLLQFVIELDAVKKYSVISSTIYRLVIVVPMALLSVGFYYWILLSLIRTIQQLTLRRQGLKLEMYKAFLAVLSITVVFSSVAAIYQVWRGVRKEGRKLDVDAWQESWFEDLFSESLFCFVMLATAFLWRPRENNTRYGYAEFFTDEDNGNDEIELETDDTTVQLETLTIVGGGELSKRNKPSTQTTTTTTPANVAPSGVSGEGETDIAAVLPHLTEFEKDIITFDLSDDSDDVSVQTQLKKLD
eukprot:TRINITY_DN4598_c0_g1_i1.p1 TRINITY_DN4598_c0_g1~~TRINITY_DN4598_c0_g1_i1.p1  ORF type:complete len:555 (-),score=128.24 TRINITY_DN4598_c0_g1_i1:117-1781(-)